MGASHLLIIGRLADIPPDAPGNLAERPPRAAAAFRTHSAGAPAPSGAMREWRDGGDAVLTEVDGGIAVITINRPEARNAVNGDVARGIATAVDEFDGASDVRVLIITGAGGTFSAGMDLKGFLAGDSPVVPGRGFGGIAERPPAKPVIAAVEGYALAGGFELALSCDLIVASETAKFGLPEVRRGLVAGAGGLLRLPRRVPYHLAMEIALTGEHFTADRLHQAGLVSRLIGRRPGRGRRQGTRGPGGSGRPARARRHQAGHRRVGGLGQRRGVRPAGRGDPPGVHLRGRDGGRGRLRREAGARLARRVSGQRVRRAAGRYQP